MQPNRLPIAHLVFCALLVLAAECCCFGQGLQASAQSEEPYAEELRSLAAQVFENADKEGCRSGNCVLLVANFALPSGSTSELGIRLADQLSRELSEQQHGIQIVERSLLKEYLEKERIPSKLLQEKYAARWLASQLNATAILIGTVKEKPGVLQLKVQLLSVPKDGLRWSSEKIELKIPGLANELKPAEPFDNSPPSARPVEGLKIFKAGADGVTLPVCRYAPAPMYTALARSAGFQGTLVLLVTISAEGNPIDFQILRGAPFGLNEAVIQTLRSWKCEPGVKKGSPVTSIVPVEITVRSY